MALDEVVPRASPGLVVVEVDDARVVYDPARREAHLLNLTAGLILDACDGLTSSADLCSELADAFGADLEVVTAQVGATLDDFARRGLIGGDGRSWPEWRPGLDRRPGLDPPQEADGPRVVDWALDGVHLDLLGSGVHVRVEDAGQATVVRRVLAPLLAAGPLQAAAPGPRGAPEDGPVRHLDLALAGDGSTRLLVDGREVGRTTESWPAVQSLLWELNQCAAYEARGAVTLHAGAVRGPAGVAILPADSESGKSTLTAGLVRAGLGYLTDEAVAVDLGTGRVRAYPRAIGLGRGSWGLFPEVAPAADDAAAGFFQDEWHVDPTALHAGALDSGPDAPIVLVVFPTYDPREPTRLESIGRPEALFSLLHNAFNLATEGEPAVAALEELTRRAELVRLVVSDLNEAVGLITRALDLP
ncbi:MAG TPA: HPr-rel-A system PqqD family peptide chaperone [Acidimicrobiales bacterium]